jgi:hypothetical protein
LLVATRCSSRFQQCRCECIATTPARIRRPGAEVACPACHGQGNTRAAAEQRVRSLKNSLPTAAQSTVGAGVVQAGGEPTSQHRWVPGHGRLNLQQPCGGLGEHDARVAVVAQLGARHHAPPVRRQPVPAVHKLEAEPAGRRSRRHVRPAAACRNGARAICGAKPSARAIGSAGATQPSAQQCPQCGACACADGACCLVPPGGGCTWTLRVLSAQAWQHAARLSVARIGAGQQALPRSACRLARRGREELTPS